MENLIGKMIFLLLLFHVALRGNPSLDVRITNQQGVVLEEVGAGQPFTIEVIVYEAPSGITPPSIEGIEKFNARRTGVFMNSINGKSTHKYSYTLRIDKPGNYTIGPVHLTINGKIFKKEPVTITVGTQALYTKSIGHKNHTTTNTKKVPDTFLRLSLNKEKAVVGEKIEGRLRFYYDSPDLILKQIGQPQMSNVEVQNASAPQHGNQIINGISYNYAEWTWELCPLDPGILTIPAYNAYYELPAGSHNGPSSFGLFMFMQKPEVKNIYSNACTVMVDPLPVYKGRPVDAVGNFSHIHGTITPTVLKAGEAAVYTLTIEGEAYFDKIKAPLLQNMPPELKWYESQQQIDTGEGTEYIKRFEYVVQGCTSGNWEIPKQIFTFFDTKTRTCKQLELAEQLLTVLPNSAGEPIQSLASTPNKEKEETPSQISSHLLPLSTALWMPVKELPYLPFWLFILLVSIPAIVEIATLIYGYVNKYTDKNRSHRRAANAFKEAFKKLRYAQKHKEYSMVYPLFIDLFSARRGIPVNQVTHTYMEKDLLFSSNPHHLTTEWHTFLQEAAAHCYNKNMLPSENFWIDAYNWLERLQKGGL